MLEHLSDNAAFKELINAFYRIRVGFHGRYSHTQREACQVAWYDACGYGQASWLSVGERCGAWGGSSCGRLEE